MKSKQLVVPLIIAIAGIIMIPFVVHPAEAHILKTFNMTGTAMPGTPSNVSVKIGWLTEPPLQGDTNQFQIYIYKGTDDSAPPIADNGLDNMTVTLQYGGQTKDYASYFTASDDTPGLYTAAIIPSQIGTYNLIIKGNIDGVTIPPTTYPMQDVESKDTYYFPSMNGQNPQSQQTTNPSTPSQTNQAVPEFGPIASLVLVISVVSVIVVTGRMRGFLRLSNR